MHFTELYVQTKTASIQRLLFTLITGEQKNFLSTMLSTRLILHVFSQMIDQNLFLFSYVVL